MLILHVKKGLLAAMTWPCMHLDQEWHPWQHLSDAAFLCTQTLAEMQGNRKLNEEAQFIFTIVSGGMLEELLPQKWGVPRGLCIHEKKKIVYSMDQRLSNNELTSVMHESRSASGGTKKAAHSINRCAVINYYWELRKGISEALLDVVSGPEALQHRSISGCIAKDETDPFTENTHALT